MKTRKLRLCSGGEASVPETGDQSRVPLASHDRAAGVPSRAGGKWDNPHPHRSIYIFDK